MMQEVRTTMSPAEVLATAKRFFVRHNTIYAAYPEQEGPDYLTFRGQGGEELVIGVTPADGATIVRGSTYLFDQQVSRFFATLDPVPPAEADVA